MLSSCPLHRGHTPLALQSLLRPWPGGVHRGPPSLACSGLVGCPVLRGGAPPADSWAEPSVPGRALPTACPWWGSGQEADTFVAWKVLGSTETHPGWMEPRRDSEKAPVGVGPTRSAWTFLVRLGKELRMSTQRAEVT